MGEKFPHPAGGLEKDFRLHAQGAAHIPADRIPNSFIFLIVIEWVEGKLVEFLLADTPFKLPANLKRVLLPPAFAACCFKIKFKFIQDAESRMEDADAIDRTMLAASAAAAGEFKRSNQILLIDILFHLFSLPWFTGSLFVLYLKKLRT